MKNHRYLRLKLVDHCLEQFRHHLMKVIPQGHLDHPLCINCQKPGRKLNEVQDKATGKTML